jgi:hypothetical protein
MRLEKETLPKRVRLLAKLWSASWVVFHPRWQTQETYVDAWYSVGGYDLNLYAECGRLTVCAYPLVEDDRGDVVANFEDYLVLVHKGRTR